MMSRPRKEVTIWVRGRVESLLYSQDCMEVLGKDSDGERGAEQDKHWASRACGEGVNARVGFSTTPDTDIKFGEVCRKRPRKTPIRFPSNRRARLPATTEIAQTTPPPGRTVQPPLTQPPPSASLPPCPGFDEGEEVPEPYIPPLTTPTASSPIPNARLSQCLPGGYQITYQATLTCIFRPTSCLRYRINRRDQ